jgi:hypothetical protein
MDGASQSPDTQRVRHRRRSRPKGWKAIPKLVKITVPVCLAVLLLIPFARKVTLKWRRPLPTAISGPSVLATGLVLNEAKLDEATKRVAGIISNTSDISYQNVVVSYRIINDLGNEEGAVTATIDHLGPHAQSKFATDPLSKTTSRYVLREITGTPRQ